MTLELLTPKSSRRKTFIVLLDYALTEGLPEGTWRCGNDGSGGSMHQYAEAVTELGGIDIAGTIEFFRQQGGGCDCEILFNVDRPDLDDPPGDAGVTPVAA